MKGIIPVVYLENCPGGLADRMKIYEQSVGTTLDKDYPAIIRVDGRAFRTYTEGFIKPFDDAIRNAMVHAAQIMCREIQGSKLAYSQSDEITLLMCAYDNPESELWFDGRVQKIVSNAASVATEAFNEYMDKEYWPKHPERKRKRARFDARTFNLPFVEVNNCFIWRQRDAIRNSKLGMGLHHLKGETQNKNTDELVSMMASRGIDWHALPDVYKHGFCVKRIPVGGIDPATATTADDVVVRFHWTNVQSPIFSDDVSYVNKFFGELLKEY